LLAQILESRLRATISVLLFPSRSAFQEIKLRSQGSLGYSVGIIAVATGTAFVGVSLLARAPIDPIGGLWFALALTVASLIWAASALVLSGGPGTRERLSIEPFMFLGSTSLLFLFLVSGFAIFVPRIGSLLSALALIYMQVLVFLSELWLARVGVARALLATVLSPIMASVGALMLVRIVAGMPRFLDTGWLP